MEFIHEPGIFYANDQTGKRIAEVTYQAFENNQSLVLDHTFVDDSLRGQGIARQLVDQVVALARANHQTILPLCTYASALFARDDQYQDVWRREN